MSVLVPSPFLPLGTFYEIINEDIDEHDTTNNRPITSRLVLLKKFYYTVDLIDTQAFRGLQGGDAV